MAQGKLSPRQRMINMMYLVLTAMLALNVSKDILKVLQKLDDGMNLTIATVTDGTQHMYTNLENLASTNPRAVEPNRIAKLVKAKSDASFDLIHDTKEHLIEETGGRDLEDNRLNGADNRDVAENYLVNDKSIGGGGMAKEIKQDLSAYRDFLIANCQDDADMIASLNASFNFDNVVEEGKPMSWEKATFAELPLAGIVPFLTDYQSRIRRIEAQMVEYLMRSVDANAVKFDAITPIVKTPSTYVTQGDNYEAEVFFGAYNKSQNPIVTLEGEAHEEVEQGIAKFSIPATGVGERTLSGTMQMPGSPEALPFELTYTVAPPTAVISPSKMNVFYRNVDNPVEISVPGVAPGNLIVSGPGRRTGGNGKYIVNVTDIPNQTREVTYTVSVRENDGSTRVAGKKVFRVQNLPPATGMINGKSGGDMSANLFTRGEVRAVFKNFPFDMKMKVVSFEIKLPGKPAEKVRGNKIPSDVKQAITRLRPNSTVVIRNIKAQADNGSRISRVSDVALEIN